MPSKLSRDQHRLFARRFIEGFTNPYCIEYECAAGECAANLQSVSTLYVGLARDVSPTKVFSLLYNLQNSSTTPPKRSFT